MFSFEEYLQRINEGLIKTYDIDLTINNSNQRLSVLNTKYNIDKLGDNKIKLTIYDFNKTLIDNIFGLLNSNFVNLFGWFPSYMYLVNTVGMKNQMNYDEKYIKRVYKYLSEVSIIYEAKFDEELDIPNKLYHISIQEYENKIIRYGLVPKTKNKISSHGGRVYVCFKKEYCYELMDNMKFYFFDKGRLNTKWIIYEIDTNGLELKLYKDPNFLNKGGYFLGNIHPDRIKIIDKE